MSSLALVCIRYLCVAGGVDVPPVLGSCSTDLRAGMGWVSAPAMSFLALIGCSSKLRLQCTHSHSVPITPWRCCGAAGSGGERCRRATA
jgi:allophanate hydrolase subunit 2